MSTLQKRQVHCKRKEVFVLWEIPVRWVTPGLTDQGNSKNLFVRQFQVGTDISMGLLLFCPRGAVVDGSTNTHRSYTLTQCLRSAWKLIAKELSLYAVSKISDRKLQIRSTQQDRRQGQSPLFYFRSRGGQWCHHFRFRLFSTKAADQNWILVQFWNTWARAPSFLFPVQMVLGAPSFPFPEHVDGPLGAPPLPFPVEFGAKKVEASRLCMQMAAEAWPIGRIGILGQTKECLLERGPLSVRSCNCTKFVSHLVLVDCETFDGCEVTRAHHMEVLPTRSERSSFNVLYPILLD